MAREYAALQPARCSDRSQWFGGRPVGVIRLDGSGERRKASLDSLGERAATLNARFSVEQPPEGGTRVHVVLPAYAAGAGGE